MFFILFPIIFFNCSNLLTTSIIPNVYGNPSQRISSIIIVKTKNLKNINTSSNNLVITLNNPSPFKDIVR